MRASRLLSILILLQARGRMTAEDLAAEFEVSVRTIYRDVDALSAAGVPVYADRGPGGGFALLDGYRTRLTALSGEEAEALPLARLPEQARALGLGQAAALAGAKLDTALLPGSAERARRIAARLHLDPADWYRAAEEAPHLPALIRAVLDGRVVTMRYEGWKGTHDWRAEPLGVVLKGGNWYLVADARGKRRTFRVAAIETLQISDVMFAPPADFDLAAHWRESLERFETELRPMKVKLRATAEGARKLAEQGAYAAAAVRAGLADGDGVVVDLPVETLEQAARLVLGLGGEVVAVTHALREECLILGQLILDAHS